jgi:hypothetical protein
MKLRAVLLQRLQVFARLKPHGLSWRDIYFGTGSGIASDAGLARFDGKYAKASQFNPIVRFQGIFHAIKDGIDGLFSLRLADACPLNDLIDKVEFDHRSSSLMSYLFYKHIFTT